MKIIEHFFSYCPDCGFDTHKTETDAIRSADKCIEHHLDDFWGRWDGEVLNISTGFITHSAAKIDLVKRPPDNELNEGVDAAGRYWARDIEESCNIEIERIKSRESDIALLHFIKSLSNEQLNKIGRLADEEQCSRAEDMVSHDEN